MDDKAKQLVTLLETKKDDVKEDKIVLAKILNSLKSILERYYDKDSAPIKQVELLLQYSRILQKTIKDNAPISPRCSVKYLAEDSKALIDSVVEEVKTIGLPPSRDVAVSKDINITNTLIQNQTQYQNLLTSVFIEAIKDELTGKQCKELLGIVHQCKTPEEAHRSFVEKIKEYGVNVSASIVANILTNPQIWGIIGSLL